jgi:hypothetical protein
MITGFSDAESSFFVHLRQSPKYKTGWEVLVSFQIHLHKKERDFLEKIRLSLGVGKIYTGSTSVELRVSSLVDLTNVVIPWFEKYPLISKKRADFELFKQILAIMNRKEHLTIEGVRKIVAIKSSMNNGLNDKLKEAFSDTTPVERPEIKLPESITPEWLAGFVSGEGCFLIVISKSPTSKSGFGVALRFIITQNERDIELLELIKKFLNCGAIAPSSRNCYQVRVTNFKDITNIIIPLFSNYRIGGTKLEDYLDFCRAAELMENKAHLTKEGLDTITALRLGMNRGRVKDLVVLET